MSSRPDLLATLGELNRRLSRDVSLRSMSARAKRSTFQYHREFRRLMGETPKQYTLRLRLERAAARLVAGSDSVLSIALTQGFASHEVFTRAFVRYFGCTPKHYRSRFARRSAGDRERHAALLQAIGPCIRLFRFQNNNVIPRSAMTTSTIVRKDFPGQPILFIRRRVVHSQLKDMFAECFGKLFMHGHQAGLPIAGWPLARYVAMGTGLWTVDAAMPLAMPAQPDGEMQAGHLDAGPVAFAIHAGPYEQLPETNAAIERWIEANGYRAKGSPWEWYVTDPAEHPDPKDWKTEVYWPLAE
jgi:AraC family transcriptional regulator